MGIGTTTPANQLSVAGQADFSGRVGVGTTTPGQNLTVATSTSDTNATAKLGLYAWGGHLWMLQSVSGFDTNATVTAGTPAGSLQFVDLALATNQTMMTLTPGGNVGIGTSNPTNKLQVVGTVQATAYITGSDRNAKENIQPVSVDEILAKVSALPISTWTFKTDNTGTHLGPMAQDFHAAFGLGNTDSGIFTVDESGVALAAIQALKKENDAKTAEIEALKKQNEEILQRLRALEAK